MPIGSVVSLFMSVRTALIMNDRKVLPVSNSVVRFTETNQKQLFTENKQTKRKWSKLSMAEIVHFRSKINTLWSQIAMRPGTLIWINTVCYEHEVSIRIRKKTYEHTTLCTTTIILLLPLLSREMGDWLFLIEQCKQLLFMSK